MDIGSLWSYVSSMIAPTRVHYLVMIVYVIALGAMIETGTVTQQSIMDLTAWILIVLFFLGPLQQAAVNDSSSQQENDASEEE